MGSGQGKEGKSQLKSQNKNGERHLSTPLITSDQYHQEASHIQTESDFQFPCRLIDEKGNDKPDSLSNNNFQLPTSYQTNQLSIPQFPCQLHPLRIMELVNINPESKQTLFCYQCAFKSNSLNQFIEFQDIFNEPSRFVQKFGQLNDYKYESLYNMAISSTSGEQLLDFLSEQLLQMKASINAFIETQQEQLNKQKQQYTSLDKVRSIIQQFQQQCKACLIENQGDLKKLESEISKLIKQQLQKRDSLSQDLIKGCKILNQSAQIVQNFPLLLSNHLNKAIETIANLSEQIEKQKRFDDIKFIFNQELLYYDNLIQAPNQKSFDQKQDGIKIQNQENSQKIIQFNPNLLFNRFNKYQLVLEYEFEGQQSLINFNFGNSSDLRLKVETSKLDTKKITLQIDLKERFLRLEHSNGKVYLANKTDWDNLLPKINPQFQIKMEKQTTITLKSFKSLFSFDKY